MTDESDLCPESSPAVQAMPLQDWTTPELTELKIWDDTAAAKFITANDATTSVIS